MEGIYANVDVSKIGKLTYSGKFESATLGKPFVALKVVENTVYGETGEISHKGKIRLYMDPRGDVEFAIGVHSWMERMLGSSLARRSYGANEFNIKEDGAGHHYILAPTAKEVLDAYHTLQVRYNERLRAINGKEYLAVFYSCEAPVFDSAGAELPEDEELNVGMTKRRNSRNIEMKLQVAHGVLVPQASNNHERFFELEKDGRLHSVYRSKDTQALYLEYTPENIAKVDIIRRTLARAADMLSDLFDKPPAEFLKQISNNTLALGAPSEVQPQEALQEVPVPEGDGDGSPPRPHEGYRRRHRR